MARSINRLSALQVKSVSSKGLYPDGAGLYLQVSPSGAKSWVYRYQIKKRPRMVGLGSLLVTSLAEAREKASALRKTVANGIDPLEKREIDVNRARIETARQTTFQECADRYIADREGEWKNDKHKAQWRSTLKTYAYPIFGSFPVAQVDTALVLKVLEPIWKDKRETADRLRGRIEAILNWSTTREYREGPNPARWRGHLDHLLTGKRTDRGHHAALPYDDMASFFADLRKQGGTAALALQFTILTAARTSEVTNATWPEIKGNVWTIPAARMKAGKEHRVPLSRQALEICKDLREVRLTDKSPIFGLSNMAMLQLLRRMGRTELTIHGFRSTFRDWVAEKTDYPRDVAEMALAHTIGDKVEAAYRRGDLIEKRARLMQDWADYCCGPDMTGSDPSHAM